MISMMRYLTVGLFEHLDIMSVMDLDPRIKYIEYILIVSVINKYLQVLEECKESTKGLAGDQWSLGLAKVIFMEQLCTWAKVDAIDVSVDPISGSERYTSFEKELWFDLGKNIWRKHRSAFWDHSKYIHNYIVKPFRAAIL